MLTNFTINDNMKTKHGFTLIELIVLVAVVSFLVAVGTPSLQRFAEANREAAQTNLISGTLSTARSEAIKRGVNVTVCGSTNSTAAIPACDTAQWELGWIVFADMNNNGDFDNGTDELLGISEGLHGGLTMRTIDFDDPIRVRVQPNGGIRDTDGDGNSNGTFKICSQDGDVTKARGVNVSNTGRVSIAHDTDSDKTINDINNVNVTCP